MKHAELVARLEKKILGPEGQASRAVFIPEVRNAASWDGDRTLDAISMGLWKSRGLLLEGYEVKVRRPDFLSELRRPEKAEAVARYLDRFWIVTDREVVRDAGEIPAGWGWMECVPNGLSVRKEAPAQEPEPISRSFLAALLRRSVKMDLPALREQVRIEVTQALEHAARSDTRELEYAAERGRTLLAAWEAFREKAGVEFSYVLAWPEDRIQQVAAVVAAVTQADGNAEDLVKRLIRERDRAADLADLYGTAAAMLER